MNDRPLTPHYETKCFVFKATAIATIEGYVWASSYDEATELINKRNYDELENIKIEEIDDIQELGEE